MRFLVVTRSRQALPMEAAGMMIEGLQGWAKKYVSSGKFEQLWGFAGLPGGGGIANVGSIDELDSVMSEFPLAQFSEIEIYALTDLDKSIENAKNAFKRMMPQNR
jgi:muconolactone delta-isomerase